MSDARPQVWITGLGTISCLGRGLDSMWAGVMNGRSGIVNGHGAVREEDLADLPEGLRANRALAFSVVAIDEAMRQAGWTTLSPTDGLILATTTGLFLQWEKPFSEFVQGRVPVSEFRRSFVHQPLGELSAAVRRHYGHTGPSVLVSSACSASTQALGLASLWIQSGRVKRCLVVGVEVLCALTSDGFRSLQLLSPEPSRPFDRARGGINLSEGAGALCLEGQAARKVRVARLSGYGFTSDGHHMTGPHPEGDGSFRAMKQALQLARLSPSEITWVHAHGTGSVQNDLAEGLAVSRLFGKHPPWLSSTKWLHGHALAAAGALESVLALEAMRRGVILATRGLENPDEKIPARHPLSDRLEPVRHILKNTLGFGGANAAVVFSHSDEAAT